MKIVYSLSAFYNQGLTLTVVTIPITSRHGVSFGFILEKIKIKNKAWLAAYDCL